MQNHCTQTKGSSIGREVKKGRKKERDSERERDRGREKEIVEERKGENFPCEIFTNILRT